MSVITGVALAAGAGIGAMASSGGSGVQQPSQPNIQPTASDVLQSEINLAPQQYQAAATYDPQYAALYGNLINSSLLGNPATGQTGLLDTYSQAAPSLQNIQDQLNTQQLQSGLGNLQNTLPGISNAISSANPQIGQLQNQMTQNALSGQPAAGMVSAAQTGNAINPLGSLSSWQNPNMNVRAPMVGAAQSGYGISAPQQVTSGGNSALDALNQSAQQQLALGGTLGTDQQNQIANTTMSYFNQMGRSADPIDAANVALNLNSTQQQMLAQREQFASQVAGLNQQQNAQSMAAQQANQSAGIQSQGLGLNQSLSNAQLMQQAGLANQQTGLQSSLANQNAFLASQGINLQGADVYSQLQNQNNLANAGFQQQSALANQQQQYQNSLFNQNQLMQAYQAAMGTTMPAVNAALSSTLGPASGLSSAMSSAGATGGSIQGSSAQNYNPFGIATSLYGDYYNAQNGANVANANYNAGVTGGTLSMLGSLGGAAMGFL